MTHDELKKLLEDVKKLKAAVESGDECEIESVADCIRYDMSIGFSASIASSNHWDYEVFARLQPSYDGKWEHDYRDGGSQDGHQEQFESFEEALDAMLQLAINTRDSINDDIKELEEIIKGVKGESNATTN